MHEYSLRPATSEDFSFLRELHRQTLKPYVEQLWGWDEQQQENLLRERFAPEKLQVIQIAGKDTGILQVETKPNEVFLGNILLAPEFQRRGLGGKIVGDVVAQATARGLPVALTVLKPNPAKRLYERLGFQVMREDDVRYFMSRELPEIRIEKLPSS
jgi:ribosomal protein S18 acetylase RimI-like enzyme